MAQNKEKQLKLAFYSKLLPINLLLGYIITKLRSVASQCPSKLCRQYADTRLGL